MRVITSPTAAGKKSYDLGGQTSDILPQQMQRGDVINSPPAPRFPQTVRDAAFPTPPQVSRDFSRQTERLPLHLPHRKEVELSTNNHSEVHLDNDKVSSQNNAYNPSHFPRGREKYFGDNSSSNALFFPAHAVPASDSPTLIGYTQSEDGDSPNAFQASQNGVRLPSFKEKYMTHLLREEVPLPTPAVSPLHYDEMARANRNYNMNLSRQNRNNHFNSPSSSYNSESSFSSSRNSPYYHSPRFFPRQMHTENRVDDGSIARYANSHAAMMYPVHSAQSRERIAASRNPRPNNSYEANFHGSGQNSQQVGHLYHFNGARYEREHRENYKQRATLPSHYVTNVIAPGEMQCNHHSNVPSNQESALLDIKHSSVPINWGLRPECFTGALELFNSANNENFDFQSRPLLRRMKPPHPYPYLIAEALLSAPGMKLTLSGVYRSLSERYPEHYKFDKRSLESSRSWRNTVRYNLSRSGIFRRMSDEEAGLNGLTIDPEDIQRGPGRRQAYWEITPVFMEEFRKNGLNSLLEVGDARKSRRMFPEFSFNGNIESPITPYTPSEEKSDEISPTTAGTVMPGDRINYTSECEPILPGEYFLSNLNKDSNQKQPYMLRSRRGSAI